MLSPNGAQGLTGDVHASETPYREPNIPAHANQWTSVKQNELVKKFEALEQVMVQRAEKMEAMEVKKEGKQEARTLETRCSAYPWQVGHSLGRTTRADTSPCERARTCATVTARASAEQRVLRIEHTRDSIAFKEKSSACQRAGQGL